MRLKHFLAVLVLGVAGLVLSGCSGSTDPVADTSTEYTVAPSAAQGPEEAAKAQAEMEKKQAELDRAAGRP